MCAAADDGYRNTVEFLRARLRIGAPEARRRLTLAGRVLPRPGLAGRQEPPVHEELAAAVAAGEIASRAATIVTDALVRVRHVADAGTAAGMEHALTRTAAENDADFLVRVARSWTDALDQDGAEPSEELLRQRQGAFLRGRRHGLHRLEIFATTEQFEHLLTVMNTATNPRTTTPDSPATPDTDGPAADPAAAAGLVGSAGVRAPLPRLASPGRRRALRTGFGPWRFRRRGAGTLMRAPSRAGRRAPPARAGRQALPAKAG